MKDGRWSRYSEINGGRQQMKDLVNQGRVICVKWQWYRTRGMSYSNITKVDGPGKLPFSFPQTLQFSKENTSYQWIGVSHTQSWSRAKWQSVNATKINFSVPANVDMAQRFHLNALRFSVVKNQYGIDTKQSEQITGSAGSGPGGSALSNFNPLVDWIERELGGPRGGSGAWDSKEGTQGSSFEPTGIELFQYFSNCYAFWLNISLSLEQWKKEQRRDSAAISSSYIILRGNSQELRD